MQESMEARARRRNPRIHSSPARYIQPADPVYHVQPPRPTCGGVRVDIGGHDVRFDLVAMHVGARARVIDRIQQREQLARLCLPRPSSANAITDQMAACVYWPPFSRMPGG